MTGVQTCALPIWLRQEVYTQCDSNPETWNQHKERAMGTNKLAIQVNERLNDFRVKIIDIRTKLLAEGYAANAAADGQIELTKGLNALAGDDPVKGRRTGPDCGQIDPQEPEGLGVDDVEVAASVHEDLGEQIGRAHV